MRIREIMTSDAQFCQPETSLAVAARLMLENDCGILPIVNPDGKVIGLITDRDICIAAGIKNRTAYDMAVSDVTSFEVYACRPDDDVQTALEVMRREKVRRLPIIDGDGILQGILSISDVVLCSSASAGASKSSISYEDVVTAYKAICDHQPATLIEKEQQRMAISA